ncbi:MAG: excinuclease ABC subunit UvrA [Gammaproteobacteria bacterium]|nr:MAG: excinuclease ABC subunit UvrA [Gammaproteobacteria bacterium]
MKFIRVKGAKQHNLKNIDIDIPRDKLTVITGLSGSGKSSLAFDTLYAEGQRRYVESLSAYARQFLSVMDKPEVDTIEGLSPAIAIEQKSTSHNPRSTVGTVTEIYDYLRLLYSRSGSAKCLEHNISLEGQTIDQISEKILKKFAKKRILILAPLLKEQKGEHLNLFSDLLMKGYVRVSVNGIIYDLNDQIKLEKNKKHSISIVVDRLSVVSNNNSRLIQSLETCITESNGLVEILDMDDESINDSYSTKMACPKCGFSIQELEPRLFSFNSPSGACSSCDGLGYKSKIDLSKLILRPELSLNQGAIKDWDASHTYHNQYLLNRVSNTIGFSLDTPFENLTDKEQEIILYGSTEEINFSYVSKRGFKREIYKPFEGIVNNIERRLSDTDSNFRRDYYAKFMTNTFCDECEGTRLNLEARSVFINNFSLPEIVSMTIDDSLEFFSNLSIPGVKGEIALKIIKEIKERLNFLSDVGLNYLTLSRSAETLSGGEAQRIRLASQIGAGLVGVTYILDEPSIGLHQRDNKKLLSTLKRLKELGNTVIVVEHDQETIEEADHIIDIGPKAGVHGGEVCFSGNINDLKKATNSLTSKYVFGKKKIQINKKNKIEDKGMIKISGCSGNNLKKVNLEIPLGNIIAITGVSGSGKSTLINQTLYPALSNKLNKSSLKTEPFEVIEGIDLIDKVIEISQSPIGRTPRSNPVTYTGIFTPIRELFAGTQEARSKGYKPGRFSFNVKGGRCEACEGDGMIKVEMHFLPDVYVKCDVCDGQRYNSETLTIRYKGKNISEVLGLTVEQATVFFQAVPKIKKKLDTLNEVGLGYLRLGQPATTLSGGEAQRVKLAKELSKTSTGRTIYLLDEPTTGLHFHDVQLLMDVLHKLNSQGNTIVVIEHNLDVIKNSDWIIDIGPEGGNGGGEIVAAGILDKVSKVKKSYTGKFLK